MNYEGRHSVDAALKTELLQAHFQQDWCLQQDASVVVAAWGYIIFQVKIIRRINL